MRKSYITHILPLGFGSMIPQEKIVDWFARTMEMIPNETFSPAEKSQAMDLYQRLAETTRIVSRRSVVSDFSHFDREHYSFFKDSRTSPWYQPALNDRMKFYADVALACAENLYQTPSQAELFFDVSCTGYHSPNTMQKICESKGRHSARNIRLGHMGCYAALPAVNLASMTAQVQGSVSLLFTELCTLHLNLLTCDPGEIVGNSLFSDGAVRMEVGEERRGLETIGYDEVLIPGTGDKMGWTIGSQFFQLSLAKDIPFKIARVVESYVSSFLHRHDLDLTELDLVAIHPGGPKIIDLVAEKLRLDDTRVRHSYEVFREMGNMSSCTLPYIWDRILRDPGVGKGAMILSLSFGPGLTLAMNLLRKVSHG
jgi:predicted naringenin-chalcone synthase